MGLDLQADSAGLVRTVGGHRGRGELSEQHRLNRQRFVPLLAPAGIGRPWGTDAGSRRGSVDHYGGDGKRSECRMVLEVPGLAACPTSKGIALSGVTQQTRWVGLARSGAVL
jgi:hypothetical protein